MGFQTMEIKVTKGPALSDSTWKELGGFVRDKLQTDYHVQILSVTVDFGAADNDSKGKHAGNGKHRILKLV